MVYDWQPYKDDCYRLYIQERKGLEDIIQYMRETHNFNPSKRAYQTQFRRWDFPSKQRPAHRNATLVERVKELFDQNCNQADMLSTLKDEGFDIKNRDLMRLRTKNRWLLRTPNGFKDEDQPPLISSDAIAEMARQRQEKLEKTQAQYEERWEAKKRRRHTRDYAGFPADPPGPPRFPSETTLDESKRILSLDADQYRIIREKFQKISEEEGVSKKTTAGAEKWQLAKDRLTQETPELQAALQTDASTRRTVELAIDVICTDVTKRMRMSESVMTIAEAKNELQLNPEQSRQVRRSFYTLLQQCQFTRKMEMGETTWQELKDKWISSEPSLQAALDVTDRLPVRERAVELICRDVLKRLRGDMNRKMTKHLRSLADVDSTGPTEDSAIPMLPTITTDASQIDPNLFEPIFETRIKKPVAVYMRSNPTSEVNTSAKTWLATLADHTVEEVKGIVASKWHDVVVVRLDGIAKSSTGDEVAFPIEEDDELEAYLDHVQGGKATLMMLMRSR